MKNAITLFCLLLVLPFSLLYGQSYYDLQWKTIEANKKQGLYKSNLPLLKAIEKRAMNDELSIPLIRSLQEQFGILNLTTDDENNDIASQFFANLQSISPKLKGESRLVFEVLSNEFLYEYYQRNQWKIQARTPVLNSDYSQIETWSTLDFKTEIQKQYSALVQKESALKAVEMAPYKELFDQRTDIDYFKTLWVYTSLQRVSFLRDQGLFTKNELDENTKTIREVYKNLLKSTQGNSKLFLEHQSLVFECEQSNCKDKIASLEALYQSTPESLEYKVKLIEELVEALITKGQHKEALNWTKVAQQGSADNPFLGAVLMQQRRILQPVVRLSFPTQMDPERPIQIVAEHKNAAGFRMKLYEASADKAGFMKVVQDSYQKDNFKNLKKTFLKEVTFSLPSLEDYKMHKTALSLEALNPGLYVGEYLVEGTSAELFYFLVSKDRVLLSKSEAKGASPDLYQLQKRETGKALARKELNVYESVRGEALKSTRLQTSATGEFSFPTSSKTSYYRNYLIESSQGQGFNLLSRYGDQGARTFEPTTETVLSTQLFLDRGIYRPGQVVYFKGIIAQYSHKTAQTNVSSGIRQTITLVDSNGETVESKTLVSNEFGSYHGNFTLPTTVLPGQFYLTASGGAQAGRDLDRSSTETSKGFRVEEYKRPNFEVVFEPILGEYRYGQKLTLKGKANSYSGVPMANTKVTYEIKKENIRWMYFRWFPQSRSTENSILGESVTNEKGEFQIELALEKDPNLEGVQVDQYKVKASVMDLNGESISSEKAFKVASVSHYLVAEGKEAYFSDKPTEIQVQVKNYNDQNLEKAYLAKLEVLNGPKKLYRDQYTPYLQDRPLLSETEFQKQFPYDRFSQSELAKESKAVRSVFDAKSLRDKTLSLGKLKPGAYELTLYNLEGSDTIRAVKRFTVYSPTALSANQKPFLAALGQKDSLQAGEKTEVYAFSAIPGARARFYIQNGDAQTKVEEIPFRNGVAKIEVIAPKDPRLDRLFVQVQVSSLGEVQTQSLSYQIEQPSKALKIETTVFRDKLEPGQKEHWSLKISGKDEQRVSAELLATMYDKSLDQFQSNRFSWNPLTPTNSYFTTYDSPEDFTSLHYALRVAYQNSKSIHSPQFSWFRPRSVVIRGFGSTKATVQRESSAKLSSQMDMAAAAAPPPAREAASESSDSQSNVEEPITIRKNLNETAFFLPELRTDSNGEVHFEFTSPEALTQWRLQFLAHTKDLEIGLLEKQVITQKKLSLTVNYPRFLREGDQIQLKIRVSSLVDQPLNGKATLEILDAATLENLTAQFGVTTSPASFALASNASGLVEYSITVPKGVRAILIKSTAKAGDFSDGEQKPIAILPNRKLVTEARAIFVKENEKKTFTLENLFKGESESLESVRASLELTTNPIWEVLFALPSLMQDPQQSADVQFNKWVSEVIGLELFKENPRLEQVFAAYQSKDLLKSNLEMNPELKELLLKETPWVLDSDTQKEQMASLARLFDTNSMRASAKANWTRLQRLQNPDGGFSWQPGAPSSYQTSVYLLKNLGRLNGWLDGDLAAYSEDSESLVKALVTYVDREVERFVQKPETFITSNLAINFLDARSYWETAYPLKGNGLNLKTLFIKKAPSYKPTDYTFYGLHRAALLLDRYKLSASSKKLITYLKETATESQTQGLYWKENAGNWGWFSSSIANHAGALEAFNSLTPGDEKTIEELKIWLVTQKEVSHWDTSRATAEVVYLLLNSGKSWTGTQSDQTEVLWGGESVKNDLVVEAPGYLKAVVNSKELSAKKGQVEVHKLGPGIAQGGLFWQYYEDLDKIGSASSVISISKELYRVESTTNGEVLTAISQTAPIRIGDRIKVRLILNSDRPMEFLHLKDQRAAALEPLDALSTYHYSGALGYYQAVRDASMDFFFEQLPKGRHVLEYELRAGASGVFSGGVASLENYYAPQMRAHTQGVKVEVRD